MENKEAIEIFNKWMDCKDAYQADPSCDGNCLSCEYYTSAEGDKEAMLLAIAALEKQEKDRWMPVTERPPETTDEVLTTYINNGNREKRYVETATYYPDDGEGTWSSPWDEYRVAGTAVEVLAWRPLPEPYQEDKA